MCSISVVYSSKKYQHSLKNDIQGIIIIIKLCLYDMTYIIFKRVTAEATICRENNDLLAVGAQCCVNFGLIQ